MQVSEEMFVLALVAISFTGAVAILLVILGMRVINQRQNNPLSPPPATPATSPSISQSKRIANSTVAMSAGLTAIVFAARLVPIPENPAIATILLVGGLAVMFFAWLRFWTIK